MLRKAHKADIDTGFFGPPMPVEPQPGAAASAPAKKP